MILLSNPNGIANLPDIRDRAPTLAAAATAAKLKKGLEKKNNAAAASAADAANASGRGLEHTNLPSTRAAGEFTQACDGCDSDEIKKKPGKIE